MKHDEIKEMVKSHFDISKPVDTESLLEKLKPMILHKCIEIKKEKKDFAQTAIFALCCVLTMFGGGLMLFPDYIDYTNELVQFIGLGLTIGFLSTLVFFIIKALLSNVSTDREMKLRGKLS